MRFFILCLIILVPLFFPIRSIAKDKPYKSTTTDECIEEKECVWYHFLLAIQKNPNHQEATKEVNIKKWLKPIRIRINANNKIVSANDINKFLEPVTKHLPVEATINPKYNFLVLFTNDIEETLNKEFKDTYGGLFVKEYKLNAKIHGKCYLIHKQNANYKNNIDSYFAFIQYDHPDIQKCLERAIYTGTGLSSIDFSPLIQKDKSEPYSKLELILIMLLYAINFDGDMSYKDAKNVFDKTYEPAIQIMKKNGVLD